MKKRILSWSLCAALLLGMLPMSALADEAGNSDAPDTSAEMPAYSGGSGTETDPWLISSVDDLKTLAETVNNGVAADFDADCIDEGDGIPGNYHGYYFKQTADMNLSSIDNWDPIGYSGSYYFAGNYDGDGHSISGAKSVGKNDELDENDDDSYGCATAGIFGWLAFNSVKNLTVKNVDFQATGKNNFGYAGGIAAVAYGSTVENCSVYNSTITSRRGPNNSNFAGGIVGIALEANFEKCASVENTINHGSYGGGFIGSLDGDGDTKFTNCFAANNIITGYSNTGSIITESSGFLGASQNGDAILTNCFVYDCVPRRDETSKAADYFGVFAGGVQYGKVKATNCYYYHSASDYKVNADTAIAKTTEEFANGTVAELLGESFVQVKKYPKFATDPADYTVVDAAIAKANTLVKTDYQNFDIVETAINNVVYNKKIIDQDAVDAMAKTIENAIAALEYKLADYTAVDAAVTKANALTKTDYADFNAVESAVNAVVRDKNITEQSEVDAMAKAIEDAIAALVKKTSSSGGGSSSGSSSSTTYPVSSSPKTDNGKVSVTTKNAKKGTTVTVTVTPDEGYTVDTISVTDKNGKSIPVTKISDTEYTFVMPASQVDIKTVFADESTTTNQFVDVRADDYFYDAVNWAAANNITSGTDSDHFTPSADCTRAQLWTMLARQAGADLTGGANWYAKAQNWAMSSGISDGTNPDKTISRAEMVTMLWRAAGSPAVSAKTSFTDVASDAYYADAVAWAAENGITSGIGGGLFAPDNACTRAQIVTFLYRAAQVK